MRGHTWQGPVGNRKLICPPPERVKEILLQLWDEGHQDFVREIIRKRGITTVSLPSPPISPQSSPSAERLRKRLPTPANLRSLPQPELIEETKILRAEGSRTSVVSGLRRMLSAVMEQPERVLRSPSRSPTPTPSSTAPDIPIARPEHLPAVGPWSVQRRQEWKAFPKLEEMPSDDRDILVPTLLVGSDGRTIREGSRAEAHFRARAAQEALHPPHQQQLPQQPQQPQRRHSSTNKLSSAPPGSAISVIEAGNNEEGNNAFDRVLRSNMEIPTIMVVRVRPEDIPRMQETAAYQGLHTSVLVRRTPSGTPPLLSPLIRGGTPMSSVNGEEDTRPFLVIGRDQQMTQGYVEMAQRGVMPGTIATDREMTSAPRHITVAQLVFVAVLAAIFTVGLVVLFRAL